MQLDGESTRCRSKQLRRARRLDHRCAAAEHGGRPNRSESRPRSSASPARSWKRTVVPRSAATSDGGSERVRTKRAGVIAKGLPLANPMRRPTGGARRTRRRQRALPARQPANSKRARAAPNRTAKVFSCARPCRSRRHARVVQAEHGTRGQADGECAPPRHAREAAVLARTRCRPSPRNRSTRAPSVRPGRGSRTASARRV